MGGNGDEKGAIRVEEIEINGDTTMAAYVFILRNYWKCPQYFDVAVLIFLFSSPTLSHFCSFRIISISYSDTVLNSHVTAVLTLLRQSLAGQEWSGRMRHTVKMPVIYQNHFICTWSWKWVHLRCVLAQLGLKQIGSFISMLLLGLNFPISLKVKWEKLTDYMYFEEENFNFGILWLLFCFVL